MAEVERLKQSLKSQLDAINGLSAILLGCAFTENCKKNYLFCFDTSVSCLLL
jgi:hypothetical protein